MSRSTPTHRRVRMSSARSQYSKAFFQSPNSDAATPVHSAATPIACGCPTRRARPSAVCWSSTMRLLSPPEIDANPVSIEIARAMRSISPARRASSRLRVWKYAPRIVSVRLKPAATAQQMSIRRNSSVGTSERLRSTNEKPRNRRCTRRTSSQNSARFGPSGNRSPTSASTRRITSIPWSVRPLMSNCSAALRLKSRARVESTRPARSRNTDAASDDRPALTSASPRLVCRSDVSTPSIGATSRARR